MYIVVFRVRKSRTTVTGKNLANKSAASVFFRALIAQKTIA
jgi:hypothetical protein